MSREAGEPISVVQTVASLGSVHGGVSRVVPQLADALCDQGCHVAIVTVNDSARSSTPVLPGRASLLGTPAFSVANHRLWSPKFTEHIAKGFAPRMPRLLHDNGLWGYTNYMAARFAARQQIPLVISPHGMLEPWALQEKGIRKRMALAVFQRKVLDSASLLMVTAQSELDSVRRAGFRQPIAIVPVGVSMPPAAARHATTARVRNILFLSRVHPKKGLLSFVEAWHRVGRPGWQITIAGPDEDGHLAEVQELIKRLGLASQFEFHGEVAGDAKRELFQSADAFALPTFSENFGLVVAEAMSYALPVLTTRGAPWSILESIRAGWWVEPGVDGLAEGLHKLLATTVEQRADMGRAGRSYVADNLGWNVAAKRVFEAYAWVLGLRGDKPAHVYVDLP
jgi:glycosyltransferase involved in cell wall biosynthesis